MALNIKNPQVEQLASELAKAMAVSKTEAIRQALIEKRKRLATTPPVVTRADRLQRFLEERVWPTNPPGADRRWSRQEEDSAVGYGAHGEPV